MKCPQCSHELAINEKFCTQCGTTIAGKNKSTDKFCTSCGQAMEEHLKFCTHCGSTRQLAEPTPTVNKPNSKSSSVTEAAAPSRETISPAMRGISAATTTTVHQTNEPVTTQQEIATTGKSKKLIWGVIALVVVLGSWLMLKPSDKESSTASAGNNENTQGSSSKKAKRSSKPSAESFTAQQLVDANTKEDLEKFKEVTHGLQQQQKAEVGDKKLARKLNSEALEALRAKDYSQGVSLLQKAHEANPADTEVSDNLGYALLLAGNPAKAEAQEMITLQYAPERASAWANLAEASARQGKSKQGIAAYIAGYRLSKKPEAFLEALKANLINPEYEASKSVLNAAIAKIENSN
jgi:Flp pilus assembly protein TadD